MRKLERIQAVKLCWKARHFRVSEPVIEGEQVRVEMSMRLKPSEFLDISETLGAAEIRRLLTPKMLHYAKAYASGKPCKVIAAEAGRSDKTVRSTLDTVRAKLDCQSVLQVARVLWEAGFLDESED